MNSRRGINSLLKFAQQAQQEVTSVTR